MRLAALPVALALVVPLACAELPDTGDPARPPGPSDSVPSAAAPPAPAPATPPLRPLPRIAPPYDVASTAAALAEWPRILPGVETRAVTSFDRAGGNDDGFSGRYSQIGPTDANGEHAILDVAGPGVLRALWLTSSVDGRSPLGLGTMRFYFDGELAPRVAIDSDALFAGKTPPFLSPLVFDNYASTGGFVSFVPLAFRGRLRVTTAVRAGFYQAHFETFPPDWDVASFAPVTPAAPAPAPLDALAKRFADTGPSSLPLEDVPLDVARRGAGEIDVLRFEPSGSPTDAEIRAARLVAWFDDDASPAIDVPLASFFGSGLGAASVRSVAWTMQPGLWESRMPMPFWRRFRLRVTGLAGRLRIHVAEMRYTEGEAGVLTAIARAESPTTPGADFVYADLVGAGKLVATVLAVEPTTPKDKQWWEGDLRSRADGARMPAIHGTGHEDDHFGGWSTALFLYPYSLPMSGAPRSDILDTEGQYNARTSFYRLWPGIGFLGALRHSTEHGNENTRQESYSSTTFVYRQPRVRLARTDAIDVGATGDKGDTTTSSFEGEDAPALTAGTQRFDRPVAFTLRIDSANLGVKLRRLYDQAPDDALSPEEARVEVDGIDVGVIWVTESNAARRWGERDFFVPPQVTRGKSSMSVRIVPLARFGAARFEAWSVLP